MALRYPQFFGSAVIAMAMVCGLGHPGHLFGDPGLALEFDGSGGQVAQVVPGSSFNTRPLTVACWVRTTDSGFAARGLVSHYADGDHDGWAMFLSGGRLRGWYFSSLANNVFGGGPGNLGMDGGFVADGLWHHLAMTIDDNGGRLFVDGAQTGSLGWTGQPATASSNRPVQIGRYSDYPTSLTGLIDEVSVWSVVKSATELRRAPLAGDEAGLVAYWKADDGAGATLADSSPHGRDATLSGGVSFVGSGLIFGSHVAVAIPGIGDDGSQDIIASDPGRAGVPVSATLQFSRPSAGPAETIQFAAAFRLIDSAGTPLALATGGTEVVVALPVGFPASAAASLQSATPGALLTPATQLDPAPVFRVEVIVRREDAGVPGAFIEQARRSNAGFQYWHFDSLASADLADNLRGRVELVTIPQRLVIGQSLAVDVAALLRRYDGYEEALAPPGLFDIAFTPRLIDVTAAGAEVPLRAGTQSVQVALDGFVEGVPRVPSSVTPALTLQLQTDAALSPTHDYVVAVDMSWTEGDGALRSVTGESAAGPLFLLSGKLTFGGIVTTFSALGGVPVDRGDGTFDLRIAAASIDGFEGTHTFAGDHIVAIDPVAGDAEFRGGDVLVSGPPQDDGQVSNVRFRRGQLTLSQAGASAELSVRLPAGFGVATRPGSRRLRGTLVKVVELSQQLTPLSATITLTNTYDPHDLYPVLERLPHRYQTVEILWEVGAGRFEFVATGSEYEREPELAALEAHAAVLQDPAAAQRFSNEGYHRHAQLRLGEAVRVTADATGCAVADATFDIAAGGSFTAHFPLGMAVGWNAPGVLQITGGTIDLAASQLGGAEASALAYAQGCPLPEGCPVPPLNPTELVSFAPATGQWRFTPDGGLHADGTVEVAAAPVDLKWGAKPAAGGGTAFTHQVDGLSLGGALVAGHVLAGDSGLPASVTGDERPSALLFSGFGSPGDPARVERPRDPSYADGLADYAGINFRAGTDAAFSGRSVIGDQQFGPYGVRAASKYYIRRAGVSGIHEAITADVLPAPQIYGYDLALDGLRLAYLDSANTDSATAGAIAVPFPSLVDVEFSRLRLTCQGDLMTADLVNPGPQVLAYWGVEILPRMMEFRGGKDALGCATSGAKFLTLGVVGSMPAITAAPLYAALGLRPSGQLVTAGDADARGSGIDSRFTLPNHIPIRGDNGGSFPLAVATKAALNDFATAEIGEPGFVSFAGSLNVPFFEDIKVHVHANPAGAANSLVYLMGGWPTDPNAGPASGWNDGGRHYFNDQNFDAGNRGFPDVPGLSLADYRNHPAASYHPRARKIWPGVVTLDYALAWDPARRSFTGFGSENDTLLVLAVDHQVKDLTSSGCSITFGAELATPRLNVSDLIASRLDLGSGIASALGGVVDVSSLADGVESLDRFVTDRVARLAGAPVDVALEGVAADIVAQLADRYAAQGGSFAFCVPGTLNAAQTLPLQAALSGMVAAGAPLATELETALDEAIAGCDTALQLVGAPGARGKIAGAVQQLGTFAGLAAGDISAPLAEAEAALAEAQRTLAEVRATLASLRGELGPGGALAGELQQATVPSTPAVQRALDAVCRHFSVERDALGAYFAEHGEAELRAVVKQHLKDTLFGDEFAQNLQVVLRARFAELRARFRAGLDLAFAEINRILNKAAGDLTGSVPIPLADEGAGSGVGDFMGAAKIDGYAQIDGEEIEEVRVNARLVMKVPDDFEIDGFLRIRNVDADTPNTSCRPPGAVDSEVTVGAHGAGNFGLYPIDARMEGRFSFDGNGGLTGLDGLLDLQSQLQIRQVSLDRVALKFGFGGGEAYVTGRVAGKVDFVASEVFSFFGRTRNPEAFGLIDRDTRKLLAPPPINAGCFTEPLTGFYMGSEAALSINEFFRIPDTCLLRLHGIYGSAGFGFVQGPDLVIGVRFLFAVEGEVLCLVRVRGEAATALSARINTGPLADLDFFAALEEATIDGVGRLSLTGTLGVCPLCVDFSKELGLRLQVKPNLGDPLDSISVGFDF